MSCNENIIKNMANEVTRNCLAKNIVVEAEFVAYLMELLLLNPKYGKLFTSTLNREVLEYFVKECGNIIARGETSLNTLQMQFLMHSNYDHFEKIAQKRLDQLRSCLKPLRTEILEANLDFDNEARMKKLFRKISIYITLYSGLGSPSFFGNIKESKAALESLFPLSELPEFLNLPGSKRYNRLEELVQLASGVRLFNKDCKKGGEMIPDLPIDILDIGNACLTTVANSLVAVMHRVNTLTTAIDDCVSIDEHTGSVRIVFGEGLTCEDYDKVFEQLICNRQYEIFMRILLDDIFMLVDNAEKQAEYYNQMLAKLHDAVNFKTAVPCDTVFPLFKQLWDVWREMQDIQYLVSIINRLMVRLSSNLETAKVSTSIVEKMLGGRRVFTDEERMQSNLTLSDQINSSNLLPQPSLSVIPRDCHYSATSFQGNKHVMFLGFCVMNLNVGALIPSSLRVPHIMHYGKRYGFATHHLATVFVKNPYRYINQAIHYARNHPQIIKLLNMDPVVKEVKDVENLVMEYVPKSKSEKKLEKDCQTETHPVAGNIDREYSWNLWEWKKRGCKLATLAKSLTHSTQTDYSHLRSEIHCQTVEPRDKELQTMREVGVSTNMCRYYQWGLRGQIDAVQHTIDLVPKDEPEKLIPSPIHRCVYCGDKKKNVGDDGNISYYSDSKYGSVAKFDGVANDGKTINGVPKLRGISEEDVAKYSDATRRRSIDKYDGETNKLRSILSKHGVAKDGSERWK